MKLRFVKMHGCGNDFVIVDGRSYTFNDWAKISRDLLDRRFGVGGDQLLVLLPSKQADIQMAIFERDGAQSEMCGNGIRCAARYLQEHGMTKPSISFETLGGKKIVDVESLQRIRVDMGIPIFEPKKIPLSENERVWGKKLTVKGESVEIYPLSMGNPHAVIFVKSIEELQWVSSIGPILEKDSLFPQRTNVEFVYVKDSKNLQVRVWERGAGETFACGTGACASAVAALVEKKAQNPVTIHFQGGDLEISWKQGESVFMTGPATKVFEGEIEI